MFAGCLDINGVGAKELANFSKSVHPVQIDVTKEQDVSDALKFVEDTIQDKGSCKYVSTQVFSRVKSSRLTPRPLKKTKTKKKPIKTFQIAAVF